MSWVNVLRRGFLPACLGWCLALQGARAESIPATPVPVPKVIKFSGCGPGGVGNVLYDTGCAACQSMATHCYVYAGFPATAVLWCGDLSSSGDTATYGCKLYNPPFITGGEWGGYRVLACPDGTNTATCTGYECPANQNWTLSGATCVRPDCVAPDVRDPATGRCVNVCQTNDAGCDDGKACTDDSCDPEVGCRHVLDPSRCTCDPGGASSVSLDASGELGLGEAPCPGLGGGASAKLTVAGSGTSDDASCRNGCTATASAMGTATAEFKMCSGNTVTVTGAGDVSVTRQHKPTCAVGTCSSGCEAGSCRTADAQGSVTGAVSRFFGTEVETSFPGGKNTVKCGGTLAASATVAGAEKEVSDQGAGAATCEDCTRRTASLSGEAGGSLTCVAGFTAGRVTQEVGCQECLSARATWTGDLTATSGACGSSVCGGVKYAANLHAELPRMTVGIKWWSVSAACSLDVTGCGEDRACGDCTCGPNGSCSELTSRLSCSVCSGRSALPACQRTP